MTATRRIVDRYTKAWAHGNFDDARKCLATDLRFRGSIDRFDDADSFIEALSSFCALVKETQMVERLYDTHRAALLYDCVTDSPAGTIRTAEFFTVGRNLITEIRLVFDATELRKAL